MTGAGPDLAEVYRREVGRCTATLVRVLGDVDVAEDAVAEAFARAAERWPTEGVPPNPGGWITTTARNWAVDRLRRESARDARERDAVRERTAVVAVDAASADDRLGRLDVVPDDQLRLIFLCCHPALGPDAQVALTLRLLGGLTTEEIARAFLVPVSTMGQRLSRAKRKIRETHLSYRLPDADDLPRRLPPVLATVYLIFTEGHAATAGSVLRRPDLIAESLRVSRTLGELLPDEPEAQGLLALLLLTHARDPARLDHRGDLVRLADQDRSQWDRALIDEGQAIVRRCLARNEPGPYQVQAAIAAVHADAAVAAETDWGQIVALYDHLLRLRPNPIVGLNRAIAVMEHAGPTAALDDLDDLELSAFHLFHAARAEALRRLGRFDEAAESLRRSLALVTNATERRHLDKQLAAVAGRNGGAS